MRGRKVRAAIPDPAAACPLDPACRRFRPPRPSALWVGDLTYVATGSGFVCVAAFGGCAAGCFADGSPSGDRDRRLCSAHRRPAGAADRSRRSPPRSEQWRCEGSLCWTPWSRPCISAAPSAMTGSCIVATGDRNASRRTMPSASPRQACSPRSAAWAAFATTPWPRRPTACSRPRSSIGAARGAAWRRSSSPPWKGSTGSTTIACWSRSEPGIAPVRWTVCGLGGYALVRVACISAS